MEESRQNPNMTANKIFRIVVISIISLAGPIYFLSLLIFDVEDLLIGIGSWISSIIIMISLNFLGYFFHNISDEIITDLKIIQKIEDYLPLFKEYRENKLFPIFFSILGIILAIINFIIITKFGDAKVNVIGKMIYTDGLPVEQKTIYLNYDNDCEDDPKDTIKRSDHGRFIFEDIPYDKQFSIYIRGNDWEEGDNCENIIILLEREHYPLWRRFFKLEIPLNTFVYVEGIESFPTPTLNSNKLTDTPTPISLPPETDAPSETPFPESTIFPTATLIRDIYDNFNDNEISIDNWSPINEFTLPSIHQENGQTLIESSGKLILPEAEAILGGLISTKPYCDIEEIQVFMSNYKYDIIDARFDNPKSWVGLTVPLPLPDGDGIKEIGIWISSGNISTNSNTRVIWTKNSWGSISGPYKDNILVIDLTANSIVLGVKFDGEYAQFSVGNIESNEMVPIQAIGYPNYFAISYKVQQGALMTFSIDEIRIDYKNDEICSPQIITESN